MQQFSSKNLYVELFVILTVYYTCLHFKECAKSRGSRAIVGLVGLVPSCHRTFVGISWVPNFFSWVFRGSQIFSRGYFVGPRLFLVGIS